MDVIKIYILKIGISDVSSHEALEEVGKWLKGGVKKYKIFTPNPEIVVLGQKDGPFEKIINNADLALPDGSGLIWAGKILGIPLKERISGVDFMVKLCGLCAKESFTVGLIGGRVGVAVKTAECLQKKHPKLKIVLAVEEWSGNFDPVSQVSRGSCQELVPSDVLARPSADGSLRALDGTPSAPATRNFISPAGEVIDILFVAFGAPKQEKWIDENLDKIPVRVAMGVGGAFDYLSGQVPRAPKFMRDHGLEWLFRLIRQPWRIKRQIIGGQFFFMVLREWFKKRVFH